MCCGLIHANLYRNLLILTKKLQLLDVLNFFLFTQDYSVYIKLEEKVF